MRLSHKLTLALTGVILLVLATNLVIRRDREIALFENDMRHDNLLLGRAVGGAAALIWARVGKAAAMNVVDDADARESHVSIRWVRLDVPAGHAEGPTNRVAVDEEPVVVHSRRAGDDDDALFTYVRVPGPEPVAIELRESLALEHAYLRKSMLQAALVSSVLVALSAVSILGLGMLLVGRPVRQLVEQARRIGRGDLSSRIVLRQRDEIGELAAEMNRMSEHLLSTRTQLEAETQAKLAALEQLRHADRLATVGKLAAGVAHEVGTPLNVITGYAQLIADECPPPHPANESAATIRAQVDRVTRIVRQLLDFSRPRPPAKEPHDLRAIVLQAVGMLETMARKRGVELVLGPDRDVQASVDPGQLQQVITNLVVNAIHASPAGTAISIDIERRGECACVSIRDRGTGMAPEVRDRIFEPFFTTKDVGEGTGLGLAVVYGIVKEHGGQIDVETEVGQGACFTISLPLEAQP